MLKAVVFDLGGVLIDWNPRYLLSPILNPKDLDYFLEHVCNSHWNEQQDAGRPFAVAIADRIERFPQYREAIELYWKEWPKMLHGSVAATEKIFYELKKQGRYRLLALTNWSAETYHFAEERYAFLREFEGVLVSGREKLIKPDPRIFQLLLSRYELKGPECVYIDDVEKNVVAARTLGFHAIQFINGEQLRKNLTELEVLP